MPAVSQADPKLPFTTTLADGRVGWICDNPLWDGETKKQTFVVWPARAERGMTAFGR